MSWWVENAPLVAWMSIISVVIVPLMVILWKLWKMDSIRAEFISRIIFLFIFPISMSIIFVLFIGTAIVPSPAWWMVGNIAIYSTVFSIIGIVQIKRSGIMVMIKATRWGKKGGKCFFTGCPCGDDESREPMKRVNGGDKTTK